MWLEEELPEVSINLDVVAFNISNHVHQEVRYGPVRHPKVLVQIGYYSVHLATWEAGSTVDVELEASWCEEGSATLGTGFSEYAFDLDGASR